MLYDGTHKKGFLYDALKFANKKSKKRNATKPLDELLLQENGGTSEEDKDAILKYLKRCVLPTEKKAVEQKMRDTVAIRRQLILDDLTKYKDCWQFYFVLPELVRFFRYFIET